LSPTVIAGSTHVWVGLTRDPETKIFRWVDGTIYDESFGVVYGANSNNVLHYALDRYQRFNDHVTTDKEKYICQGNLDRIPF